MSLVFRQNEDPVMPQRTFQTHSYLTSQPVPVGATMLSDYTHHTSMLIFWSSFSGAAQVLAVSSMHWIAFLGKTGQFRCAAAQRNYLDSVFCGAYSPFLSGWFMLTDDLDNFCFGQGRNPPGCPSACGCL